MKLTYKMVMRFLDIAKKILVLNEDFEDYFLRLEAQLGTCLLEMGYGDEILRFLGSVDDIIQMAPTGCAAHPASRPHPASFWSVCFAAIV